MTRIYCLHLVRVSRLELVRRDAIGGVYRLAGLPVPMLCGRPEVEPAGLVPRCREHWGASRVDVRHLGR